MVMLPLRVVAAVYLLVTVGTSVAQWTFLGPGDTCDPSNSQCLLTGCSTTLRKCCPYYCAECTTLTTCSSCMSLTSTYLIGSTCYWDIELGTACTADSQCTSRYYCGTSNVCVDNVKCRVKCCRRDFNECLTCGADGRCASCAATRYLSGGNCVAKKADGASCGNNDHCSSDSCKTRCCKTTHSTCSACDANGECASCPSGRYLSNNQCHAKKNDGQGCSANGECISNDCDTRCCKTTHSACAACNSWGSCASCASGRYLDNEQCYAKKPDGDTCAGNDQCVSGDCHTRCCQSSHSSCATCSSSGACASCATDRYLSGGQCYAKKADGATCGGNVECLADDCHTRCCATGYANCATCNSVGKCATCASNRYLDSSQCYVKKVDGAACAGNAQCTSNDCDTKCCKTTHPNCAACNDAGTCASCPSDRYLLAAQCYPKNSDGTTCGTNDQCISGDCDTRCCATGHTTCAECTASGTCASCPSTRYLASAQCYPKKVDGGACSGDIQCVSNDCHTRCCASGYANCATCGADGKCATCPSNRYLSNSQCYVKKADGALCSGNAECVSSDCHSRCCGAEYGNCTACADDGRCAACGAGEYLEGGRCFADKADGAACSAGYQCGSGGVCKATCCGSAYPNCATCDVDGRCAACPATRWLDGSRQCPLKKTNGLLCTAAIQCASGVCHSGRCCTTSINRARCAECTPNGNACGRCELGWRLDSTTMRCVTATASPSATSTPSASETASETASRSRSPSHGVSETPATESASHSAAPSASPAMLSASASQSSSASLTPSTSATLDSSTASRTSQLSPSVTAHPSLSNDSTATSTVADASATKDVTISAASSVSASPSKTETLVIPPVVRKPVLVKELATAVEATGGVVAVAGVAGSPAAALQMARIQGTLSVVTHCRSKKAEDEAEQGESDAAPLEFPRSLLPFVAIGADRMRYNRGAIAGNLAVAAAAPALLVAGAAGVIAGSRWRVRPGVARAAEQLGLPRPGLVEAAARLARMPAGALVVLGVASPGLAGGGAALLARLPTSPHAGLDAALALAALGTLAGGVAASVAAVRRLSGALDYEEAAVVVHRRRAKNTTTARRGSDADSDGSAEGLFSGGGGGGASSTHDVVPLPAPARWSLFGDAAWFPRVGKTSRATVADPNADSEDPLASQRLYDGWGILLARYRDPAPPPPPPQSSLSSARRTTQHQPPPCSRAAATRLACVQFFAIDFALALLVTLGEGAAEGSCAAALGLSTLGNVAALAVALFARPYNVPLKNALLVALNGVVSAASFINVAAVTADDDADAQRFVVAAAQVAAAAAFLTTVAMALSLVRVGVIRLWLRASLVPARSVRPAAAQEITEDDLELMAVGDGGGPPKRPAADVSTSSDDAALAAAAPDEGASDPLLRAPEPAPPVPAGDPAGQPAVKDAYNPRAQRAALDALLSSAIAAPALSTNPGAPVTNVVESPADDFLASLLHDDGSRLDDDSAHQRRHLSSSSDGSAPDFDAGDPSTWPAAATVRFVPEVGRRTARPQRSATQEPSTTRHELHSPRTSAAPTNDPAAAVTAEMFDIL